MNHDDADPFCASELSETRARCKTQKGERDPPRAKGDSGSAAAHRSIDLRGFHVLGQWGGVLGQPPTTIANTTTGKGGMSGEEEAPTQREEKKSGMNETWITEKNSNRTQRMHKEWE